MEVILRKTKQYENQEVIPLKDRLIWKWNFLFTGNKLVIAHLNLTIVQIAEDNKIVIILTNMETEWSSPCMLTPPSTSLLTSIPMPYNKTALHDFPNAMFLLLSHACTVLNTWWCTIHNPNNLLMKTVLLSKVKHPSRMCSVVHIRKLKTWTRKPASSATKCRSHCIPWIRCHFNARLGLLGSPLHSW